MEQNRIPKCGSSSSLPTHFNFFAISTSSSSGLRMKLSRLRQRRMWPCAGETQILTSGDAFCVAPAQGKHSDRPRSAGVFCAGETQILTCRDAFFVALRRRNANLTSWDAFCVHIMWIHEESRPDERKSPRRYSETPKKFPSQRFAHEMQMLTSGVAFFVALHRENRGDPKFAPGPKRLYRKNPSVCHTVWGKRP